MSWKRFGSVLALAAAFMPLGASAYTYKIIHDFCSKRLCTDGTTPITGLTMDLAGNLYGTTYGNQGSPSGSVYELVPNADRSKWQLKVLYKFASASADGYGPQSPPIIDAAGNLYGTLALGGDNGSGTAYELIPNPGHTYRIFKRIASFDGTDGQFATTVLAYQGQASGAPYDGVSPLYSTLARFGISDSGSVYRLAPDGSGGWTHSTIHKFCSLSGCADGGDPRGPLMVDGSGNILGAVTNGGPAGGLGVVFKLADAGGGSWTETVLHSFCTEPHCRDGFAPVGVAADATGNLFGVTTGGGHNKPNCCGVLYELESGGAFDALYTFCSRGNCRDGAGSVGVPVMDSSGTLFGLTASGGGHNRDSGHAGGGTIYSWNGTALTTLYSFCALRDCRDGSYPAGSLVMDADGNLFGVTTEGGKFGLGAVFELSP